MFRWLASLLVVVAGCGASFRAVEAGHEIPGVVRIDLVESRGDLIVASVTNLGQVPLVINRDAMVLKTAHRVLKRVEGGSSTSYTVPPGGRQQVNARYEVGLITTGETVQLSFDEAIVDTTGTRVVSPPIALTKQ